MHYSERLKICKIPTLHYRHIRGNMIEIYKTVTKISACVEVVAPIYVV